MNAKSRRPDERNDRDSQNTREQLLAAAVYLFARQGLDGVSVQEICDRAKVNVSLVSYHFGGKEALYRECLERFGRERLKDAEMILKTPQTIEELRLRLELYMEKFLLCHVEQPDVARLIHREVEHGLPYAKDIFADIFLRSFGMFENFLKSAQDKRLLRAKLDIHTAAAVLFGSILKLASNDLINEKFFGKSIKNADYRSEICKDTVTIFLFGVSNEAK